MIVWKQYSPFFAQPWYLDLILITVDLISSKKEQRPDGICGFEAIFLVTTNYPENNQVKIVWTSDALI